MTIAAAAAPAREHRGPAPCSPGPAPRPPPAPQLECDGALRAFCCPGCAQAGAFIRDQGLLDYYRLRRTEASRAATDLDFSLWDRDDLLTEHSRALDDGSREITLLTDGMRCAACAWLIDRALRSDPAVLDVSANAVTGRIRLRWQAQRRALSALLSQLALLGYTPQLAPGAAHEAARLGERRRMILRLGVAGLGMLQAMMFAEALYLDFDNQMPAATRDFFRWIAFLVSTPVVFYSGAPFLSGMRRELAARRLGMDTLIASSVLLAYGASLVETLRGGAHVWFDAAVMFVFLLLAARAIEQFARRRANAVVEQLGRARPAVARRLRDDGSLESVPLAALAAGDQLQLGVGDALPADGVLLDAGEFDESLLTGESRPVARAIGDIALAGSHCVGRPVRMRVVHCGQQTRLSQLARLVEAAQDARPRLARLAERLSSHFVNALFVAAIITYAVWSQLAPDRAFEIALAVLVVSCPCALALAIPAGLAVSHGTLARIGVLSLRADAIDTLARIDTLLLDKTGTLTNGRPRITARQSFGWISDQRAAAIAAVLERDSGHPLAAAFALPAGTAVPSARELRSVTGRGVAGSIDGTEYRLGRADFAAQGTEDDGALWLGDGRLALARFEIRDPLRDDAAQAVAALRALGIEVEIASGDSPPRVAAVARELGIEQFVARCDPESKLARLRALQASGRRVGMLGDGINDAPVLAGADVSIALGSGAALAHQAADLVLTGSQLLRLPQAITIARRTRRILAQNLGWAIAYNVIALPFAALGWVTPWLAALGMAGSSLLVTANALRLARVPSTVTREPSCSHLPTADGPGERVGNPPPSPDATGHAVATARPGTLPCSPC